MPTAISFTADAGTDVLTAAAHGLLTGDRFRTRNVGGALPAPLAAVTTYFAIRIDANTLKVATSSANALAGTAVNITDAGTGTHTLEYGLPYCEPRVATAGTQIYSADDNAAWDALKAIHALFTGQTETVWGGDVTLAGDLTVGGDLKRGDRVLMTSGLAGNGSDWFTDVDGCMNYQGGAGADHLIVPLPLHTGDQIKSVSFQLSGDSSADVTVTVYALAADMTRTSIGTTTVNNQSPTWTLHTINVTDTVVPVGGGAFFDVIPSASNARVGPIAVTYNRP